MSARLEVKNWRVFQHYKDRSPPWIKLQKSLLDDFDFQMLPIASKALAPMLWLLASEHEDGSIDADPRRIAFRLRWPEADIIAGLKPLIDGGFLFVASGALAPCLQDATPETETETETDTTSSVPSDVVSARAPKTRKGKLDRSSDLIAIGCSERLVSDWKAIRKAKDGGPITETVLEVLEREAESAGISIPEAVRCSVENGWRGFKASWYRNLRADEERPIARAGPSHDPPRQMRGSAALNAALDRILPDAPHNQAIPHGPVLSLSRAG